MPKIPRLTQQSQYGLGREATGQDFGAGAGAATAQLGQSVDAAGDIAARFADSVESARVSRAVAETSAALEDYRSKLERDPDFSTHSQRYREKADELLGTARDQLRGQYARQFDVSMAGRNAEIGQRVRENVRVKQAEYAIGALDDSTLELERQFGRAETSAERDLIESQAEEAIGRAIDSGAITPQNGVARLQRFRKRNADGRIRAKIRQDPGAAAIELLDPESPLVGALSESERQQYIDQARSAFHAEQSRLQSQATAARLALERAEKERGEAALRDADDLLESGDLDALAQFVNGQARETLPPEKRRYYLERIAAGGGFTDAQSDRGTYIDLSRRAARGEDVSEDVDNAMRSGLLSKADRDRIVADQEDRRFGDARSFLASSLKVSEQALGPQGFVSRARSAEALRSFSDWQIAHPNATRQQAMDEARALVHDASVITLQNIAIAQLAPRYLVKDSAGTYDILTTRQKTQQAFEKGKLTPEDYDEQLERIERLEAALEAQRAAGAQKTTGAQ